METHLDYTIAKGDRQERELRRRVERIENGARVELAPEIHVTPAGGVRQTAEERMIGLGRMGEREK